MATAPVVDPSGVLTNVISEALLLALVLIARWISSRLARRNPQHRTASVYSVVCVWGVGVLVYPLARLPYPTMFATASSALVLYFLYRDLNSFWRVGLMGVDTQVQKGIDYAQSLAMCVNSLEFLGIGASKLTRASDAFKTAIDSCHNPERPIRFLLSRPDHNSLHRAALRAGRDSKAYEEDVLTSLRAIAGLKHQANNIEVRFYEDVPPFRLMFINDRVCLVSYYVLGKGSGAELPQLHIVNLDRDVSSIYYAFRTYYERLWREAAAWDFSEYLE